jgi:DNA polymerase elongation subunit (family B)
MTVEELVKVLQLKTGYIKKSPKIIAVIFDTTIETAKRALKEARKLKKHPRVGIKRLFFDIETSPMIVYSWRVGHNLNLTTENIIQDWKIMCISYKWEGQDTVRTLYWDENKCDKALLEKFIKVAESADELIAHNGDRFDLPKIRTKCIYHRIPMFPDFKSLDTLKKARSGFKFNSNRLGYIAEYLGVGEKLETNGFQLWKDCYEQVPGALETLGRYCERDVIILEDVYKVMRNYMKQNTHVGVHIGNDKYSCKSCGKEEVFLLKSVVTPAGTIKRKMKCKGCSYTFEISNREYTNYLKNGNS